MKSGVQIPLQSGGFESAADRIMKQLDNRLIGEPKPTRKQVSMVLHALADHTAIMHMTQFDRSDKWNKGQEEEFWPTETSIGRWFHAVADDLEGRFDFNPEEVSLCASCNCMTHTTYGGNAEGSHFNDFCGKCGEPK